MTTIQTNDLVGLTRDLDSNLPEGLVGRVLQCHGDYFDVRFPLQGSDPVHARVASEDVKLLVGESSLQSEDEG